MGTSTSKKEGRSPDRTETFAVCSPKGTSGGRGGIINILTSLPRSPSRGLAHPEIFIRLIIWIFRTPYLILAIIEDPEEVNRNHRHREI